MSYLITKTILTYKNGDLRIIKEPMQTHDLEQFRRHLREKHNCRKIAFTYQEVKNEEVRVKNY